MSQERILEDAARILNEEREYMKIFETLEDYTVTEENLSEVEDLIYLLEAQEKMLRNVRKNLLLKCRGYNIKRLMRYLESEKRIWAGIS
jgi:hypothetical protein